MIYKLKISQDFLRVLYFKHWLYSAGCILICLFSLGSYSQTANDFDYIYISPEPMSNYVSLNNNIAIRVGEKLDPGLLKTANIIVKGSKSGVITGKIKLSDDQLTLIFKPVNAYQTNEIVTVHLIDGIQTKTGKKIPSLEYQFQTTSLNSDKYRALHKPIYQDILDNNFRETGETKNTSKKFVRGDSLPEGYPDMTITMSTGPCPGYFFITPNEGGLWNKYMIIMDNHATPVFYRTSKWGVMNMELQPNGLITYCDPPAYKFYGMNSYYQVVDTFAAGNGYNCDFHELRVSEDNHYFIQSYDPQIVDMDTVVPGGLPGATVVGLIVQEIDSDNNVVFQWRSWDHYEITDASDWLQLDNSLHIDYVHGNSIALDSDTSLLISPRNFHEITKIDRRTGDIIWRLNGEKNQFEFINDTLTFAVQHSVLEMDNGNISIFDNSGGKTDTSTFSSALEYKIDEIAKTATLINRVRRIPDAWGMWMGNTYRMDNGHIINGWGHADTLSYIDNRPGITEFDPEGNMVWDILYNNTSYRAFKHQWKTESFTFNTDTIDFGLISQTDSATMIVMLYNNTANDMEINLILNHEPVFSVINPVPFIIPAGESVEIEVKFNPSIRHHYEDVFTFCSDTEEGNQKQRIAQQLYVKGEDNNEFGINDFQENIIKIIPNPNNGTFKIESMDDSPKSIRIFKSNGELIYRKAHFSSEMDKIDISDQPEGIYFVEIYNIETRQTHVEKIILR